MRETATALRNPQIEYDKSVPIVAAGRVPSERNTRQKQAIRQVFRQSPRPLSVEEVLAAAEDVSLPTVYRTVRALVGEGWLVSVALPGRTPVYETATREHHHHFTCIACDRVYELEGCRTTDIAVPSGFIAVDHNITVTGYCSACKAPARRVSTA